MELDSAMFSGGGVPWWEVSRRGKKGGGIFVGGGSGRIGLVSGRGDVEEGVSWPRAGGGRAWRARAAGDRVRWRRMLILLPSKEEQPSLPRCGFLSAYSMELWCAPGRGTERNGTGRWHILPTSSRSFFAVAAAAFSLSSYILPCPIIRECRTVVIAWSLGHPFCESAVSFRRNSCVQLVWLSAHAAHRSSHNQGCAFIEHFRRNS